MKRIILIVGLPGSGKTTLAKKIATLTGCAHVNADAVRESISRDLKFTQVDREIQAYRLGRLTALSLETPIGYTVEETRHLNNCVVVDFVCPTPTTMKKFISGVNMRSRDAYLHTIWMDTISASESRFPDTAKLFESPEKCDWRISGWKNAEYLELAAKQIIVATTLEAERREELEQCFEGPEETGANGTPVKWPKSQVVGRSGDMTPSGESYIRVGLDSDNDVFVEVCDNKEPYDCHRASLEFCNGGGGGGASPKTRRALINLMSAIEEDNERAPGKAWPNFEKKLAGGT